MHLTRHHARAGGRAGRRHPPLWPALLRVLLFVLVLTPPSAPAQSRAATDSPAVAGLMAQPLGDDAVGTFWALPALDGLGLKYEAEQLRPLLLHNYLRALEGRVPATGRTVGQALRREGEHHPEGVRPDGVILNADKRWNAILQEQLRIEWPRQPMPVPDEFASSGHAWRELGPGLWHASYPNGQPRLLVLSLQVRNRHRLPVPLGDFSSQPLFSLYPLDCTRTRSGTAAGLLLPPNGSVMPYLCVARRPPPLDDPSLKRAAAQLRRDGRLDLAINSPLFDDTERQRLVADALAASVEARATAFLAENESCARRGNCPSPAAQHQSAQDEAARWQPLFAPVDLSDSQQLRNGLLGLFALHCLIAWLQGNGRAAVVSGTITFVVTGLHAATLVSAGSPGDGWGRVVTLMVSAAALAATVILPLLVGWAFHALCAVLGRLLGRFPGRAPGRR